MKDQLKTIRAGVAEFAEGDGQKGLGMILGAVAQLEAMVGAQEPVAWIDGGDLELMRKHGRGCIAWGQEQNNAKTPLYAAPVAQQPQAEPVDEILKERDDAEDFIDMLLDEVLGTDRPEWTSAYGRDDALRDVQERMTALHKPTVDEAWARFERAQQPQCWCTTCSMPVEYAPGHENGEPK